MGGPAHRGVGRGRCVPWRGLPAMLWLLFAVAGSSASTTRTEAIRAKRKHCTWPSLRPPLSSPRTRALPACSAFLPTTPPPLPHLAIYIRLHQSYTPSLRAPTPPSRTATGGPTAGPRIPPPRDGVASTAPHGGAAATRTEAWGGTRRDAPAPRTTARVTEVTGAPSCPHPACLCAAPHPTPPRPLRRPPAPPSSWLPPCSSTPAPPAGRRTECPPPHRPCCAPSPRRARRAPPRPRRPATQ